MYNWIALLYRRNEHNIVNWLYFNLLKKKVHICENCKPGWLRIYFHKTENTTDTVVFIPFSCKLPLSMYHMPGFGLGSADMVSKTRYDPCPYRTQSSEGDEPWSNNDTGIKQ